MRRTTVEDHSEALKLANAAIKASKPNSDHLLPAQHARVVALLKLDRFEDALRALADGGNALRELCVLEKSYALYKTGELAAAEELLERAAVNANRGAKHVAAQVAYRRENFDKAAAIYQDLSSEEAGKQYGEENDLRINLAASYAQLEWQGRGGAVPEDQKQPSREDLEAFETAYNAACGCISRGDFSKAAVLLKRSRDLCEATEDLDDDEKKKELVPIIVQQAYVFARLGKLDEAASLHKALDLSEVPDESTKIIAKANSLILEAGENPFLTDRIFASLPVALGNDKLFGYQSSTLQHDELVIDLKAQKYSRVAKTTHSTMDGESTPAVTASKADLGVLNAAAVCQLQTGKEALRQLLPLLERRPDDLGLLLTIIQLYIHLKNPMPALGLLEAFFKRLEAAISPDHADVRFAPGLIALAVALYRSQGQHAAIRRELAKAAAHWQGKGSSDSMAAGGNYLIREAGIELLRSTHPSDLAAAGDAFSYLVSAQPGDKTATAGLVASLATHDFAKVQPHLDSLPAVEKAIDGVDIDALIDTGVATLTTIPQPASKKRSLDESGASKQPAAKKRKRKLPKSYDPNKKPDPERWLPLRDRSTYRPKGKKGKKRAQEATQGGVVREEEILELAGGAGSVRVEKAPVGGGGGGNKKKKKGKK